MIDRAAADRYNATRLTGADRDLLVAALGGDAELVAIFQLAHGLTVDGKFGPATSAELEAVLASRGDDDDDTPGRYVLDNGIIDRRAFAHSNRYGHIRGYPRVRPMSGVTGLTLHQMKGDYDGEERLDSIGAHMSLTQSGLMLWHYDFDRRVFHANGWNGGCIGFEVGGDFPGLESMRRPHHDDLSPELEAKAVIMIDWAIAKVNLEGGNMRAFVSHRQSAGSRRGDPGERLWKRLALPAMKRHGLSDGGDGFKLGDGRANCTQWDPDRTADW